MTTRATRPDDTGVRRILVATPVFGLGNLVLLTGLLANLRRLHAAASVTLALPSCGHARTVIGPELADEILAFDPDSRRDIVAFAWRELRPRRFDLGLATFFMPPLRAALLLWLGGCRERVAFGRDGRRPLLNTTTHVDPGGHELDRHLQLLAAPGRTLERRIRLTPDPEAATWADGLLARPGLGGTSRLVGIHPGCEPVNAQKRWPAERFGAIVRRLLADGRTGVLVVLGPGERDLVSALDLPESPRLLLVVDEPLGRVLALLARCHTVVSNDSGLMHAAAALGVPVAAIFGPTPLEKNAPVGRAAILEVPDLDCRPCWSAPPLTCRRERRYCLEGVSVEQVLQATERLLAAGATP